MAASTFPTKNYTSEDFVESCGAVLFDLAAEPPQVCLIRPIKTEAWLLPKGRRNCNESRKHAAVREVQEETGYACSIYPVTMPTRAPHASDAYDVSDEPRTHPNLDEPFMVSVRELDKGVKFIWWYIAQKQGQEAAREAEPGLEASFFPYEEALTKLTFQGDREVVRRAVDVLAKNLA